MNITELCYLDRVSYKGKPIVVCGINGTFNEVTDENNNIYDASVLSPIEVTDEMLLLNGFTNMGVSLSYTFGKSHIIWFKITNVVIYASDVNAVRDDSIRIKAKHVHKLIHLLSDVGLTEMVRNFRTK